MVLGVHSGHCAATLCSEWTLNAYSIPSFGQQKPDNPCGLGNRVSNFSNTRDTVFQNFSVLLLKWTCMLLCLLSGLQGAKPLCDLLLSHAQLPAGCSKLVCVCWHNVTFTTRCPKEVSKGTGKFEFPCRICLLRIRNCSLSSSSLNSHLQKHIISHPNGG